MAKETVVADSKTLSHCLSRQLGNTTKTLRVDVEQLAYCRSVNREENRFSSRKYFSEHFHFSVTDDVTHLKLQSFGK
jgi:hypothetical protein